MSDEEHTKPSDDGRTTPESRAAAARDAAIRLLRNATGFPPAIDENAVTLRHEFDDPIVFLHALHPTCGFWQHPNPRAWIFRGHADASWKLLPSAHRKESWVPFTSRHAKPFDPTLATETERWRREKDLIRAFCDRADRLGLQLPGESPSDENWPHWPMGEDVPAAALAQHYKVPTRLLDWTRRATVAAYFAVNERRAEADDVAVWALNARFVREYCGDISDARGARAPACYAVATAPRHSNPFLHAQDGVFTCSPLLTTLQPLDEHLATLVTEWKRTSDGFHSKGGACLLRKLVLPAKYCDSLLGYLSNEGVTALTMFPGYEGIAGSMREEYRLGDLEPEF